MQTPDQDWPRWAAVLQHYHLDQLTAWVLDAGGPFVLLAAQALYFLRPFIGPGSSDPLARMLEDEGQVRRFVNYLQSGEIHG